MEINNSIYETMGHMWWSEDAGFEISSPTWAGPFGSPKAMADKVPDSTGNLKATA
jgi:hypothetical protein